MRTLHLKSLPGGLRRPHLRAGFDSAAYRASVEEVLDVRGFLRWAGVVVLLGSWDTYYGTPGNYFLCNSGRAGREREFMAAPYVTFLPWDHDNILGVTYDTTQRVYDDSDWAGGHVVDWPMSRRADGTPRLPLLVNLLRHKDFLRYHLDHLDHLLDTTFAPPTIADAIARWWDRARPSAYLEFDTPDGPPDPARRFANHDVWRHTDRQERLRFADRTLDPITAVAPTAPGRRSPSCAGAIQRGRAASPSRSGPTRCRRAVGVA